MQRAFVNYQKYFVCRAKTLRSITWGKNMLQIAIAILQWGYVILQWGYVILQRRYVMLQKGYVI